MLDLEPATNTLGRLVVAVRDDQLDAPTPCADTTLGDLLDHVDGLAMAFTAAAKTPLDGPQSPSADASRLGPDWRRRIPERLAALASAWRAQSAWTGMTTAGGIEMPGEIAAIVALNEVIVHGWDIAVASAQGFDAEPELVDAAYGFATATVADYPQGAPGLFGPPVPVPDDAPLLSRLLALTGRNPGWRRNGGAA